MQNTGERVRRAAVRYYSRSGNTEKLARAAADALCLEALDTEHPLEEPADILFLCCSYYAFDVDEAVKRFLRENTAQIGKVVCIGSSAMMHSLQKPLKKAADAAGVALSTDEFHCRGAFKFAHRGRPNAEDLAAAAAFARAAYAKG